MAMIAFDTKKVWNMDALLGIQWDATWQAAQGSDTGHWRLTFKPIQRYPDDDSNVANRGLIKSFADTGETIANVDTRDILWANMMQNTREFPQTLHITAIQANNKRAKFFWNKMPGDIIYRLSNRGKTFFDFSVHFPDPALPRTNRHPRDKNQRFDYLNLVASAGARIYSDYVYVRPSRGQSGPSGQAEALPVDPLPESA